jgi:hypothetical protein
LEVLREKDRDEARGKTLSKRRGSGDERRGMRSDFLL